MKCCSICDRNGCQAQTRVSFYRFPRDEKTAKEWLKSLGRVDLLTKGLHHVQNNLRICNRHFESRMFAHQLTGSRLRKDAVPTLLCGLPMKPKKNKNKVYLIKSKNRVQQMIPTEISHEVVLGESPQPPVIIKETIDLSQAIHNTEDSDQDHSYSIRSRPQEAGPSSCSESEAKTITAEEFFQFVDQNFDSDVTRFIKIQYELNLKNTVGKISVRSLSSLR